jgi:hypothetical protein
VDRVLGPREVRPLVFHDPGEDAGIALDEVAPALDDVDEQALGREGERAQVGAEGAEGAVLLVAVVGGEDRVRFGVYAPCEVEVSHLADGAGVDDGVASMMPTFS